MLPSAFIKMLKGASLLVVTFVFVRIMLLFGVSTQEPEAKVLLFQSSEEFRGLQKEFGSNGLGAIGRRKTSVSEKYVPRFEHRKSRYNPHDRVDVSDLLSARFRTPPAPQRVEDSLLQSLFNRQPEMLEQTEDKDGYEKRLPKCLIVGFGKCGTHALKAFLAFHPELVVTNPEINFFNHKYHRGLEFYRNRQPMSYPNQITIEKSPTYINNKTAMELIYRMNSTIRLVAVVRDPIVHLQSQYAHEFEHGTVSTTFQKWLAGMDVIKTHGYLQPIRDALRIFPRNQLHVVDGEELVSQPFNTLKELEHFLRLTPFFAKDDFYFNEKKGFYCANPGTLNTTGTDKMDPLTGCFGSTKGREHTQIPPWLMKQLVRQHEAHNEALFRLLGKRFAWKGINDL